MSFTQACCDRCWLPYRIGVRGFGSTPVRVKVGGEPLSEPCCFCGEPTKGIFIRVDPDEVPYPRSEREEQR